MRIWCFVRILVGLAEMSAKTASMRQKAHRSLADGSFTLNFKPSIDIIAMYTVSIPKWITYLYPKRLWHMPRTEKKMYLSFDDGPTHQITSWILNQLNFYNAKATFFCVGANVERYPTLYRQIRDSGHSIGNHSHNHLNGWRTSTPLYVKNVKQCQRLIPSNLFRPPYGKLTRQQARALLPEHKIVMWDVLSGDFDPKVSWKKCVNNILTYSKNGSIIVLHDNIKALKSLKYTLPLVLKHYTRLGFEFCALV